MGRTDAWWLLALPLYQFIGTARHEWSHALAAILQGARIVEMELLPSIHPVHGFLWGYVRYEGGRPDWIATAAPYFGDLLVIALFAFLCIRLPTMPRWLWLNGFILGIASPLADVAYNYQKVFTRPYGDVNRLMQVFPPPWVHAVFLGMVALFFGCAWAALHAFKQARTIAPETGPPGRAALLP